MNKKAELSDIMPIIRGANYMKNIKRLHFGPRCNYATQLFYLAKGRVSCEINNIQYDMNSGDFILYGPNDVHCIQSIGDEEISCSTINFSWNKNVAVNLQVGNQHVRNLDEDYLKKADIPVVVDSLPPFPFFLHIPEYNQMMIKQLLSEIGYNFNNANEISRIRLRGLLLEFFHIIITINIEPKKLHPIIWGDKFKKYLDENFKNSTLNRKKTSKALGISESHLTASLRKELHTNFTDALTSKRMDNAVELLLHTDMSIKEIADSIGFAHYSYFVYKFRGIYNKTPMELRNT